MNMRDIEQGLDQIQADFRTCSK
nr:hypothetical protein [Bartonella mastomydis]